ncbi:hypothetical protein OG562_18850 [Streptomyces sp. NBC_01275]|uniref:hypothetical protein n=1 Tax=Streptomyces sp. NBC_01275 TaxID=2903807 RepID=UPI00224ED981|nr:hypothetical protein [Streptomyces sp. NBC_01275]MCX4763000.1 hypothetical protein [Streptomyces sp. NBC_01275]
MGDTFQTIVDRDASPQDAPRLAERVVDWLVAEGIVLAEAEPGWALSERPAHPPGPNWHKAVADARWGAPEGLAVYSEHHIFYSPDALGPAAVTCGRCAATTLLEGDLAAIFETATIRWHETGVADADCPACAETVPLSAWRWNDDQLAFAHLGFQFWNWPAFSEEFRARIGELLGGHGTAFLMGKI